MEFVEAVRAAGHVKGWLTADEQRLLYDLARGVRPGGTIVELGSWMGRSTIILGAGSLSGPRATVYAVDLFAEAGVNSVYSPHLGDGGVDYFPAFTANVQGAGVGGVVVPVRGMTVDAARGWTGPPIDLLFIDADHRYEGVRGDFLEWSAHCAPGAWCVFHDYFSVDSPGVRRFVDRLVVRGVLTDLRFAGSILGGRLAVTDRAEVEGRLRPRLTDKLRPGVNRAPWHDFAVNLGWIAFRKRDRREALYRAAQAIRSAPWRSGGWRLLACAAAKPLPA